MKVFGMKQFNMVDCNLKKSTDLKILNFNSNYISMLIVTEKSYVYAEKYYKNRKLQSCLTLEIFKEQRRTEVNYDRVKYLLFSNLVEYNEFDEAEFLNTLRKNRIYFHRWYEKGGVINTSTYLNQLSLLNSFNKISPSVLSMINGALINKKPKRLSDFKKDN